MMITEIHVLLKEEDYRSSFSFQVVFHHDGGEKFSVLDMDKIRLRTLDDCEAVEYIRLPPRFKPGIVKVHLLRSTPITFTPEETIEVGIQREEGPK